MLTFREEEFLSDSHIAKANEILQLERQILEAFISAAAKVRKDTAIREKIINGYRRVLLADEDRFPAKAAEFMTIGEEQDPYIEEILGTQKGMFAALLALVLVHRTALHYDYKEIPRQVLVDTMSDLPIWMKHYRHEHGVWGLGNIEWLTHHLAGRLYRLGRMQFMYGSFQQSVIVLRNRYNGKVTALSDAGVFYRRDGLVEGTNGIYDGDNKWEAAFEDSDAYYSGNPIFSGLACRDTVRLPTAEWQIVLRRGDPVLDIHIAEGSKMSHDRCRESLHHAVRFYRDYFPQHSFRAFVCTSWLLDPQLQDLLPDSSNIIKFQNEFYLFPVLSDEGDTYQRVFGTRTIDLRTASRDTGLRRAILDYHAAGNRLHAASGFLLLDDLASGMNKQF